ncbi:WD40 repeat-like protein [Pluteus cervinus]|uniref:WD40 repeat-like protein n=1 Tax=Pluteus cervinus TaxID=181527 RepID=A0ACD3AS54_9AGAR|nr:WD40 repeat-like protein [Pluteus cervinus]
MSFFKKSSKKPLDKAQPGPPVGFLHITEVKMPSSIRTNGNLCLKIADGDPQNPNIRPYQVHQIKFPERVDGSEIVVFAGKTIPIKSTHLILEIVELHHFHPDKSQAKHQVLWGDILYVLKQSNQEVVIFTIPKTQVDLVIKKESLKALLQQIVLPWSLIEYLSKAQLAMNLITSIGDPLSQLHSTAQLVVGLIKSVVAILQQQTLCYEKLSHLFKRMASLLSYFEKMQNLKSFNNVQPVINLMLVHMEATLQEVLEHSSSSSFKRFLDVALLSQQADKFSELSSEFDRLFEEYNTALHLDMAILQDQSKANQALERLNYTEIVPGNQCLENTRVSFLADIENWVLDRGQPVLWLHGPAGTGKSTIATTVAQQLETAGRLAAFYTCRRDQKSLSNPLQLWRNISYRLSKVHKPFGSHVAQAVESDPHFGSGADTIFTLFQKLLKQPLSLVDTEPLVTPLVIVIDALDECGSESDRIALLNSLLELRGICSWIKVFITSRNNPEILRCLKDHAKLVALHTDSSSNDVELYIRSAYSALQLSDVHINLLIKAADGLFIWAATALKYLEQCTDVDESVQVLLAPQGNGFSEMYTQLYGLYYNILNSVTGDSSSNLKTLLQVINVVIIAAHPLSVLAISKLITKPKKTVEKIIDRLHAVLTIDEDSIVRILHPSFAEYLLYKPNHPEHVYWVDSHSGHGSLASGCFQVLKSDLKFNVYNISSSYMLNRDVSGLSERINDPELWPVHYAALFWTFHLLESNVVTVEQGQTFVSIFNGPNTLYWLEILSLHGAVYNRMNSLQSITQMVERTMIESDMAIKLHTQEVLGDIYHFIDLAKEAAAMSIPHIYISCLAYMPKTCVLGQTILPYFEKMLQIHGKVDRWILHPMVLEGHNSWVMAVAASPDGKYVASGSSDKTVRIWDTTTGQQIGKPFQGHRREVSSLSYSPDGKTVVSGSWDKTVRIWDVNTGQLVGQPLRGHTGHVTSVSYSPDGKNIVSGSDDKTIRIWNASTRKPIGQSLCGHTDQIMSVSYAPDGLHIASGSVDKTIRIWDAYTGQPTGQPLTGHTKSVTCSYSPDGNYIVSGSHDKSVRIWNAATGHPIGQILQAESSVFTVTYCSNGQYVIAGCVDGRMQMWDAATGELIGQPSNGHDDQVTSLCYLPDGKHIVSGSWDKTIKLWDINTFQAVGPSFQGESCIRSVSYSPDGKHAVSGSEDKTVRIWDVSTGQLIGQPLEGHTNWVRSVSYSPGGKHVVSGSDDKTLRIWNANTFQQIGQPLEGHKGYVTSVSYSPDGKYIVSGSEDKTLIIWDATTGKRIGHPLQGHIEAVTSSEYGVLAQAN